MSAEVVQSSSTSSLQNNPTSNNGLYEHNHLNVIDTSSLSPLASETYTKERKRRRQRREEEEEEREYQLNSVGFFFTAFRRSVLGCSSCEVKARLSTSSSSSSSSSSFGGMEIGLPTNVRHVAHVTFDRFNGFLGLPVEFEPEVPTRAPSASATVFGVSTNSMQLSFDARGNSVPTILLLMQHRLYALGGLQAEGIFRINPDNGQEECVRDQLNRGLVPDNVDVHCLAGLIKAWFRELPTGVLDSLTPEQVMQSQTEDECTELASLLPPTEAAVLDWAINLMTDVAQFEHLNKMNARNVAMVFAPNMTHVLDPLTALMHAVQVMNFLKTLIEKTLKHRQDFITNSSVHSHNQDPCDHNRQSTPLQTILEDTSDSELDDDGGDQCQVSKSLHPTAADHPTSTETIIISLSSQGDDEATQEGATLTPESKICTPKKGPQKSLVSSVTLRTERTEAWR